MPDYKTKEDEPFMTLNMCSCMPLLSLRKHFTTHQEYCRHFLEPKAEKRQCLCTERLRESSTGIPVFRQLVLRFAGSTYLLRLWDRHKHMWRVRGVTYKTQGTQKKQWWDAHTMLITAGLKSIKTLSGATNILKIKIRCDWDKIHKIMTDVQLHARTHAHTVSKINLFKCFK